MAEIESFNIDLLYVFVKVAELQSINKSSEALSLTQPAISKKIQQLENFYKTALFVRSSKGMVLTPAGQKSYREAQKLISAFQTMKKEISPKRLSIKDLRIGSLDSISSHLYPQFFIETLSKVRAVSITNQICDLIKPFNAHSLDAILMDSAFDNDIVGDYVAKQLYEEPYYLVYAKNNARVAQLNSPVVKAQDLQRLDLLMYPKYCPIHQRIVQIYHELQLDVPKIVEIDYSESTVVLVSRSEFVTILPESLAVNKVTQDISHLEMKKMTLAFSRNVSLFAREEDVLQLIISIMNAHELKN